MPFQSGRVRSCGMAGCSGRGWQSSHLSGRRLKSPVPGRYLPTITKMHPSSLVRTAASPGVTGANALWFSPSVPTPLPPPCCLLQPSPSSLSKVGWCHPVLRTPETHGHSQHSPAPLATTQQPLSPPAASRAVFGGEAVFSSHQTFVCGVSPPGTLLRLCSDSSLFYFLFSFLCH